VIGTRVALVLVSAFVLTGCASAIALPLKKADAIGPCQTAVPERDLLLGVALSGGGSRAGLFGEAGLRALAGLRAADGASLIDKIAHLSSVGREPLGQAFFDRYRAELSQDFETSLIWRQLLSFRWVKTRRSSFEASSSRASFPTRRPSESSCSVTPRPDGRRT
jgi:hypothetical protein